MIVRARVASRVSAVKWFPITGCINKTREIATSMDKLSGKRLNDVDLQPIDKEFQVTNDCWEKKK